MTTGLADNALDELERPIEMEEAERPTWYAISRFSTNDSDVVVGFEEKGFENRIISVNAKLWFGRQEQAINYCPLSGVMLNPVASIPGNLVVSGTVVIDGGVAVGGAVVVGGAVAVDSNPVFSAGLTIRGQMPTAHFYIWPAAGEPRDLTRDLEQLSWDRCRQTLSYFASYAKEILKRKGTAVTETRIRNWQSIEDSSWKQCILDLTVKAESHIALSIWDELSEELQKFINTQPEVFRPFLKDKLSLDVKWV